MSIQQIFCVTTILLICWTKITVAVAEESIVRIADDTVIVQVTTDWCFSEIEASELLSNQWQHLQNKTGICLSTESGLPPSCDKSLQESRVKPYGTQYRMVRVLQLSFEEFQKLRASEEDAKGVFPKRYSWQVAWIMAAFIMGLRAVRRLDRFWNGYHRRRAIGGGLVTAIIIGVIGTVCF